MNSVKISGNENPQADLVVIGGGGSGLAAAVAAAEKGIKNISLLEVRGVLGGNSVFPTGLLATGTPLQKRLGIETHKDDVFRKAVEYAHWKLDAKLVRALVDKSVDTIRWLEEKGVNFVRVVPFYPYQTPCTYHVSNGPKCTGATIVEALVTNCQKLGVQVICQTAAKKILTDERGNLTGVLAAAKDKELRINANSVIIATGGLAGNKELLKKHDPSSNEHEVSFL